MGLDASIYEKFADGTRREVYYWRKNHSLQNVMEKIYRYAGGDDPSFNNIELPLPKRALQDAIRLCREGKWYHWKRDLVVLRFALLKSMDGASIVYEPCW